MPKAKVFHNKRNNQLTLAIARSKFEFLKKKIPKSVILKLKEEDFEY